VIDHMAKRRLDPRLGRWAATERLCPPKRPLSQKQIVRRWAAQLLRRWGIVSRDIRDLEPAAPRWGELAAEFKRLELLGKVSRGYFIANHRGEQVALPEAVEMLRDCRARRADGHELGTLADEPLMTLTNRDPANLYARCLPILDERGTELPRRQKAGNVIHRLVVQAGQVLVYETDQLVTLTGPQLRRCIEKIKQSWARQAEADGSRRCVIRRWNGYPVDISPVAGVLQEAGFRFNARRELVWPPPRNAPEPAAPPGAEREVFSPYYADSPPVTYGPDWLVARAEGPLQPAARAVLDLLAGAMAGADWQIEWHDDRMHASLASAAFLDYRQAKSFVEARVWAKGIRDPAGTWHGMSPWNRDHQCRAATAAKVNDDFAARLGALLARAAGIADMHRAKP
jgi:hypothetical protein